MKDGLREAIVTRTLPPSTLEIALLTAVEQARAGHQLEMAVSLSMMLESLRLQQENAPAASRLNSGSLAHT